MRDRDLVRLYWPVELRPAFDALFDIDDAMADVVARSTEPTLAAIKLAWWRDRLEELDQGKVPAEPRLQAAARELLGRGIAGAQLASLESGWGTLLDEKRDAKLALQRGTNLFALAAQLLDAEHWPALDVAGQAYALGSQMRHGLSMTPGAGAELLPASPRRLRPLTGLAALAMRDLKRGPDRIEAEATPGRAWTLLRHRFTGNY